MDLNRLLRALSVADRDLLRPSLESVELFRGTVLESIGSRTDHVHFLQTGLVASVARSPHRRIGVGVVGNDGMTGLDVVQNAGRAANEAIVQAAGTSLRIDSDKLRSAMERSPTLHAMLLRYAHVFMVQASQTALTNAHAPIEERLARWILMSDDRFEGGDLHVTHEFISLMVGVRRAGITDAMHVLEGNHLIKARRDSLHVVDRQGLIALAAGSYGVCEEEYERLIGHSCRQTPPRRVAPLPGFSIGQ
jgi:CRP-like cAMP-binding protein